MVLRNFLRCLFLIGLASLSGQAQQIVNGKADVSQYNFVTNQPLDLSGTWEFYWNQLLGPADFTGAPKPIYLKVPGSWHRHGYPVIGYGTYRVELTLPDNQNNLSIYFPIINSAGKIWVNGDLVGETGVVSADQKIYKPKLSSTIITLPDKVGTVEIIVQVANFTYSSSGMVYTPQLGNTSIIFSQTDERSGIENFFAGSLIAMFFYQIILYFIYHRGRAYLWLSLICLGVALRAMIVHGGSFLLPNIFPSVEWEIWKKIEFGTVYAIVVIFPLYVYNLFIEHAPKKPIAFFAGLAAVLCALVLATPQSFYGKLLDVGHLGLLLAFVYAVYSITKAWRAGNEDAKIILFGVLSSFPFILLEILKNSLVTGLNINFMYLVELGVLIFLLFQVYLLANHYAKAYKNLEAMNVNLEKVVEERTSQLVTANTVKDRLLSVMSHDIKAPLNSLRGILQIFNIGAINQQEFIELTRQVEGDLNKTSLLLENILFWTASQLKGIDVKVEKFNVHQLVEENLHLFKSIADSKKITLSHNTPIKFEVVNDRNILNLVLRNLIANAIKFSFDGGMVDVRVTIADKHFTLQVIDKGVGMDLHAIENLLSSESTKSTSGTKNEKGTGLGLLLCKEYLQKAGGQLTVESTHGKGSTFTIQLPLDR